MVAFKVDKFVVFLNEGKLNGADRAISLFSDNDFDNVLFFRFLIVIIIAV